MARPSKTNDNIAVVNVGGKDRRSVIRWDGNSFVLLLSNHGRYNNEVDFASTVSALLRAYNGRLLQN